MAEQWPGPYDRPGAGRGHHSTEEELASKGWGVVLTVEAVEAMIIMMAVLMAMDLGQIDVEATSITVLQEHQITDTGVVALLPWGHRGTGHCTHARIASQSHWERHFYSFLTAQPRESMYWNWSWWQSNWWSRWRVCSAGRCCGSYVKTQSKYATQICRTLLDFYSRSKRWCLCKPAQFGGLASHLLSGGYGGGHGGRAAWVDMTKFYMKIQWFFHQTLHRQPRSCEQQLLQ